MNVYTLHTTWYTTYLERACLYSHVLWFFLLIFLLSHHQRDLQKFSHVLKDDFSSQLKNSISRATYKILSQTIDNILYYLCSNIPLKIKIRATKKTTSPNLVCITSDPLSLAFLPSCTYIIVSYQFKMVKYIKLSNKNHVTVRSI